MYIDRLGVAVEAVAPHRSDDRLAGEDATAVAQQQGEEVEFLRSEPELHALDVDGARGTVDPEAFELLDLWCTRGA